MGNSQNDQSQNQKCPDVNQLIVNLSPTDSQTGIIQLCWWQFNRGNQRKYFLMIPLHMRNAMSATIAKFAPGVS